MAAQERIVVVGWNADSVESGERRIDFFDWDKTIDQVNLKDYDVWVLLPDTLNGDSDNSNLWSRLSVSYVHDALLHRTDIYVLGDARRKVPKKHEGTPQFLHWSGLDIRWDTASSTATTYDDDSLGKFGIADYVKQRSRWDYALESAINYGEGLGGSPLVRLRNNFFQYDVVKVPLCNNRYGRSIVFALTLAAYEKGPREHHWSVQDTFGNIIALPLHSQNLAESLRAFIREAFDLNIEEVEPGWLNEISAPGQSEIEVKLAEANARLVEAAAQMERISEEMKGIRKPLNVLYQTGSSLEHAVRALLVSMGAELEVPDERNREDGWITVKSPEGILEGVLEIKGVSKSHFDSYGIKQLLEWKNRGIELRLKKYKAIFIGTSSPQLPPSDREDPFPDSWKKQASLAGIAAITTDTLLSAFEMKMNGQLDVMAFWLKLFDIDGVFSKVDIPKVNGSL